MSGLNTVGEIKVGGKVKISKDGGTARLEMYQETISYDAFTDGGSTAGTLELDTTIPAGAVVERSTIHSLTGFAGDTSAVITIGDGTDADRYNTGTPNVFADASAGVDLGVPSGTAFHATAKTPTVTITSDSDWGSVTAGSAVITIWYYKPV